MTEVEKPSYQWPPLVFNDLCEQKFQVFQIFFPSYKNQVRSKLSVCKIMNLSYFCKHDHSHSY